MTKKEQNILRMASRKCGVSYRSLANRNQLEIAKKLVAEGKLRMSDNGKDRSRFVFWSAEK